MSYLCWRETSSRDPSKGSQGSQGNEHFQYGILRFWENMVEKRYFQH